MTDEVIKLNLYITKELIASMPVEDYEVIEQVQDGEPLKLYKFRPLVAGFMRDDAGKPMTKAAALKVLGKIPVGKWGEVAKQFADALTGTAIPNGSASSSDSPSVPPPPSEYQPG